MNLKVLLTLLGETTDLRRLMAALDQASPVRAVALSSARPYLLAALAQKMAPPLVIITPGPERARHLQEQVARWLGGEEESSVCLFPELELSPGPEVSPTPVGGRERLRLLARLYQGDHLPSVIVAPIAAVAQSVPPPARWREQRQHLVGGDRASLEGLLAQWVNWGYEAVSTVETPGTFARRGGILDIFPPQEERPLRIELVGNRVESLRSFDPFTQRSLAQTASVTIGPAQEQVGEGSFLAHLPSGSLVVMEEAEELAATLDETRARDRELGLEGAHLGWGDLASELASRRRLLLESWAGEEGGSLRLGQLLPAPSYGGRLELALDDIKRSLSQGGRLVVVSRQARRLAELLREADIAAVPTSELAGVPSPGALALVSSALGGLAEGFALALPQGPLTLLTDGELFGIVKQRRWVPRPVSPRPTWEEPQVGDYVVHVDHGIGRFRGIQSMAPEGVEREYLVLEYAEGDKLYVPADQIDRLSRYVGPGDFAPSLSRLGTQEWTRTKERVRRATRETARELLRLYAAREVVPGIAFSPDTAWQEELEASFPYEETPDQLQVVGEVKADMERPQPMDRLVVGDVGYGKTEVAVRAAFKAVMDGMQVAVLVPTTVLAQQHYQTFSERLAPFPARVEVLSRFRTEAEQREVLEGLRSGTVDICIGTHRLLQKDVAFRNLGLVIVDEEQRFGVVHKEHLKQLRTEVDVLTLSATPIPRTLHLSLVGVRDMSSMEISPEARLPVRTFVAEYDSRLIRQAALRELERGGQVFFVHNRVQSMGRIAAELAELVPEASIVVGHGQMPEEELERVMVEFAAGRHDVLLCTTIIEAGLDLPNVNTIIIDQAERFGLAQLYQLRGRVGRGVNQAYCYLLYRKGTRLTDEARRRLRTIFEAQELGAGARIALKDMEIRGAGNILGAEQSGHIAAVGFELYNQLLAEAVGRLREERGTRVTEQVPRLPQPTVDLPLSANLPQDYVPELRDRLSLYHRMAGVRRPEELTELSQELADRFGPPPPPAQSLLYLGRLRVLAARCLVESVQAQGEVVVVQMWGQAAIPHRERLERAELPGLRVGRRQLRLQMLAGWRERLLSILEAMAR